MFTNKPREYDCDSPATQQALTTDRATLYHPLASACLIAACMEAAGLDSGSRVESRL
jgi:hypothetical protein